MNQKKTFRNVDEYIASQPEPIRPLLEEVRQLIRKAAPQATEVISYGMPGYKLGGMLIWFGAAKNHYAIYPHAETIEAFKDKLSGYKTSKGTIQFPFDRPVPATLITEIVKFKVKTHLEKSKPKK